MKHLLICCLILFPFFTSAQELSDYKDTLHHFSVGVPQGWRVWKNNKVPTLKFVAQRLLSDSSRQAPENFNISIMDEPGSNVDKVVKKLLNYTSRNPYFKLIDSGSMMNNGKRMLWLDEMHTEANYPDTFFASIFVTCTDNKAYLLTATTLWASSGVYGPLFHQIGGTFRAGKPARKERLKITFPANTKWKLVTDTDIDNFATRQYVTSNETPEKWTQMLYVMTMENVKVPDIAQAIKSFTDAAVRKSPDARITILGKENLPGRRWALFKVEAPALPGDTLPESQLYYVIQGARSFHAAFIAKKEATLPAAYIKTWGDIFRKSRLVNE